jgi:chemotaxis protein MotB
MLSSPILFDSGRSELKTSSYPIMHEVAALIKDIPNRIVIEGHTDNQPVNTSEFKSNWELSAARAFSVVRYFIEKEKLDPERLAGLGYGEYRPLLANDSEDNRSKNRRVEVNIIRVAH